MTAMTAHDRRVTAKHISWKEYVLTFVVLQILTAGQMLILGAFVDLQRVPSAYAFGMVGYWALATLIYCLFTSWQRFRLFDQPMRTLSAAAQQVAHGDFSVSVAPLHPAGKQDYVDVMFEDFNRMVQELGSIETLKTTFIADVSHEIKTPLAVIQSYARALQNKHLSPQAGAEYTDTILMASKKLTTLVTNILRLSKLENQAITPAAEPFDLCGQLSACALAFEAVWEHKQISFVAELEDRCTIWSDEQMLEIVWNNLLANALKYTEPGGTVTLTQTSDDDTVTVTVADTGCGMDQGTMHRIFEKFYQGDTSRSSEGNGLGLALVRKVIDLLHGTIAVTSTPGHGTTFTVTLPA